MNLRRTIMSGAGLSALALLGACGGGEDKPAGPQKLNSEQLVRKVGPTTVKLYGKWGDTMTAGSGVVIDAEQGFVLTNAHVVDGTSGLKAQFNDEPEEYTARVEATAPCQDLAVVKITTPPQGIKAMAIGNSSKLKAGQHVTTLGYPGTLEENRVAPGSSKLVFADGRVSTPETTTTLAGLGEYQSITQHTATVNHGNSGGPLVDDFGRLVGINTLGNTGEAGEVEDQFYSITIDHAKPTIEKLKQGLSIANVGWNLTQFTPDILYAYITPEKRARAVLNYMAGDTDGVYVNWTQAGSPAGRANIEGGDYISAIDDNKVTSPSEVCDAFESATPGSIVKVEGRYLDNADGVAQVEGYEDTLPGDPWTQNVRVPEEEALDTEAAG